MIRGGCLCGGIRFEVSRVVGPFELCHCSRCRKVSGSAFLATIGVLRKDFRLLQGEELIQVYDAPILKEPPAYRSCFCKRCGSPVPNYLGSEDFMEIEAGLLDDDPGIRPDKHIFVNVKSPWFAITDGLPQFTEAELKKWRKENN